MSISVWLLRAANVGLIASPSINQLAMRMLPPTLIGTGHDIYIINGKVGHIHVSQAYLIDASSGSS